MAGKMGILINLLELLYFHQKVSATVVVLILDSNAEDVLLLKSLVILYALKSIISLPFTIFAHMNPRRQGEPLTARDILLERYRTLMEIAGTCLFFLSNYFLFSKPGWRDEAPATFFLCVANVAIGYIVILIPVLLCLAVILCLPLVVRIMRYLDIGPVVGIKGATEEMIAAIPIVIYRKPVETEVSSSLVVDMGNSTPSGSQGERTEHVASSPSTPGHSPSPSTSSPPQPTSSVAPSPGHRSKGGFLGFFMKGKKQAKGKKPNEGPSSTPAVEYLTLSDAQDAVCAICLCDYEDDEELRKMACVHYFHKECVDEWLRLHKNCPLCKRDIEDLAGAASGASRSPTTSS
ncbi:hypothetical protein BG000_001816 [Podila horticola]|nr:hypothetical protein BG000_001816 [Podila horticola]